MLSEISIVKVTLLQVFLLLPFSTALARQKDPLPDKEPAEAGNRKYKKRKMSYTNGAGPYPNTIPGLNGAGRLYFNSIPRDTLAPPNMFHT
ncbi:hypothetical protein [Pontibacter liquoris]|uniref:hypothetical protein n=1 Tax=Pontibacter liquoris TaxID=2905677 RepID=UPI001FA6B447|nr:hypothetical protein [Pontibacter liquoris]